MKRILLFLATHLAMVLVLSLTQAISPTPKGRFT